MGKRACYYKGVRLWEVFQDWYPWASRTGEGSHDGITFVDLDTQVSFTVWMRGSCDGAAQPLEAGCLRSAR